MSSKPSVKHAPRLIARGSRTHLGMIAVGAALVVAVIVAGSQLGAFHQGQLTKVAIFAIAIAGLNIATGYVGLLSVGHSAFFGLGAYVTGVLITKYGWEPLSTIPVALVISLVVGLLVGLPALRIRGLYFAMVTLAFGVAFPEIVGRFQSLTGGAQGLTIRRQQLRPPGWSGFSLGEKDQWQYWLAVAMLLIVMLVVHNLARGRYGLALIAVRDNEIAASSSGINVAVLKTASFGVSGAITGVAGSLFAMYIGSLFAEGSFTVLAGITLLIGLVIGGSATRMGPVIGALIVVYLPYYTSGIGQGQASAVLFSVVLITVIFVAPAGVMGGISSFASRFFQVVPSVQANGALFDGSGPPSDESTGEPPADAEASSAPDPESRLSANPASPR